MIIIIAISFIIGVVLSIIGFRRPIVIKYSYAKFEWSEPIFIALTSFLCAFLLEYILLTGLASYLQQYNDSIFLDVAISALSNGFLIPFFSAFISFIFGRVVESLNLDYHRLYSNLVAKICFFVIIMTTSVKMLAIVYAEYDSPDYVMNYQVLNRIIIWIITAIGIWMSFGYGCDGRINKENRKRISCKDDITPKEYIDFWLPIIIPLLICFVIVLCMDNIYADSFAQKYMIPAAGSFLCGGLIVLFALKALFNPGEKLSKSNFYYAFRASKTIKGKSFRFGKMKCIFRDDQIYIEKVNVQYPEHEDEDFKKLFDEDYIDINAFTKDEILKKLIKRREDQITYIANEFEKCRRDRKDSLLVTLDSNDGNSNDITK